MSGMTVRDVIKKNFSKNKLPMCKIIFGCGELTLHFGFSNGEIECYAMGLGKKACEQILNLNVEKYEIDYDSNIPCGFYFIEVKIMLKSEETECVII